MRQSKSMKNAKQRARRAARKGYCLKHAWFLCPICQKAAQQGVTVDALQPDLQTTGSGGGSGKRRNSRQPAIG
jgi:hypothetical protein